MLTVIMYNSFGHINDGHEQHNIKPAAFLPNHIDVRTLAENDMN